MADEVGLTARLQPTVDKKQLNRETGRVERQFDKVSDITPSLNVGRLRKQFMRALPGGRAIQRYLNFDSGGGSSASKGGSSTGGKVQAGLAKKQLDELKDIKEKLDQIGYEMSRGGGGGGGGGLFGTIGKYFALKKIGGAAAGAGGFLKALGGDALGGAKGILGGATSLGSSALSPILAPLQGIVDQARRSREGEKSLFGDMFKDLDLGGGAPGGSSGGAGTTPMMIQAPVIDELKGVDLLPDHDLNTLSEFTIGMPSPDEIPKLNAPHVGELPKLQPPSISEVPSINIDVPKWLSDMFGGGSNGGATGFRNGPRARPGHDTSDQSLLGDISLDGNFDVDPQRIASDVADEIAQTVEDYVDRQIEDLRADVTDATGGFL